MPYLSKHRNIPISLGLALTLLFGATHANDDRELAELLLVLEQQTEIATKTGLNKDYVPGLVTLLESNDLEKRGLVRVADALRLVPGLDVLQNQIGEEQLIIRGVARTFAASNVKMMLNGVALNSAGNSSATPLFEMPISQIDRIEVIRGPGSAIHGKFALMGVVNIITRQHDKRISGELDDQTSVSSGGVYHWQSNDLGWNFALNAALSYDPGGNLDVPSDTLSSTPFASASNAPGDANTRSRYRSLLLSGNSIDNSFLVQYLENAEGDHFGINQLLPPDEQRLVTTTTWLNIEGEHRVTLGDDTRIDLRMGWLQTDSETRERFAGPPEFFDGPPGTDIVADARRKEDRLFISGDLVHRIVKHQFLFSGGASYTEITGSSLALNLDPSSNTPIPRKTSRPPPIPDGTSRWSYFLAMQDEWRLDDSLSLTLGTRYDYLDDTGSAISPRIAAVYRLDRNTTFKTQYARAFRPPTLLEIAGQINAIDPVTSDTFEAAMIYGQRGNRLALTLFHHEIRDLIMFTLSGTTRGFDNVSEAHSSGVEIEIERRFNRYLTLDGNLSFSRPIDDSTNDDVIDSTRWLGNLGLRFSPYHDIDIHLQVNHTGERARARNDARSPAHATTSADLTLSWAANPETTLRFGVRNIGNTRIIDPVPANTFINDHPRADRTFWLGVIYQPKI